MMKDEIFEQEERWAFNQHAATRLFDRTVSALRVGKVTERLKTAWIAGPHGSGITLLLTHLLRMEHEMGREVIANYRLTFGDFVTSPSILQYTDEELEGKIVGLDGDAYLFDRYPDIQARYRANLLRLLRQDVAPVFIGTQKHVLRELTLSQSGCDILNAVQLYLEPRYNRELNLIDIWIHDWQENPHRNWPPQIDQADAHLRIRGADAMFSAYNTLDLPEHRL